MERLQLKGQSLGQVFNPRSVCVSVAHSCCYLAKRPNLKWKDRPKHASGPLLLDIALPREGYYSELKFFKILSELFLQKKHPDFEFSTPFT
jgi:hypothetical protein